MDKEQMEILVQIKEIKFILIFLASVAIGYITQKLMIRADNFFIKILYILLPLLWCIYLMIIFLV